MIEKKHLIILGITVILLIIGICVIHAVTTETTDVENETYRLINDTRQLMNDTSQLMEKEERLYSVLTELARERGIEV